MILWRCRTCKTELMLPTGVNPSTHFKPNIHETCTEKMHAARSLRMPAVWCNGNATIRPEPPDDPLANEVRVSFSVGKKPLVLHLKREKTETYDDFVRRVVHVCDAEFAKL